MAWQKQFLSSEPPDLAIRRERLNSYHPAILSQIGGLGKKSGTNFLNRHLQF
jgi:hypothetical protein